jgi:polyphosphate kinase
MADQLSAAPDPGEVRNYLNRELSWLDFNARVLALAEDPQIPLLERVKFVAIFSSNLDEFFQVRVAGLKDQLAAGVKGRSPDGRTASEQLRAVLARASELAAQADELFLGELCPALADQGIVYSTWAQLDDDDRDWLRSEFEQRIFPVLTPLAVDPGHPFPYISSLSLNLGVIVRDPSTDERRFARVKVPPLLPRFVIMPDGERFVPLEQVIAAHLDGLFPGMEVADHVAFRVTRNADLTVEEEEADDLLAAIEVELRRRRFGKAVRLEVEDDISAEALELIRDELELDDPDVFAYAGPVGLSGLFSVAEMDRPELQYPTFKPVTQRRLTSEEGERLDIFAAISDADLLVHHPYDSFTTSVEEFIRQAANDSKVLAIKLTLYRTSGDSPIVASLIRAAEQGKQVVALVELKARFDEERNIEWARRLEQAGVHVVYGLLGLKTHTKTCLVVRDESHGVVRYCHVGTGNYNPKTARLYEDFGLLTAAPEIGADLSQLFNYLTGYARNVDYQKLLMAPHALRPALVDLIRNERRAAPGTGHIVMKMNSLVDPDMIDELYAASADGVRVELIIRGICCLRPQVPGLSDHITVRSLLGRYLEHSRIYRFANGRGPGAECHYIGSADLMPRNLDRRVEAVVPIDDPDLRARLDEVIAVEMADDTLAWELVDDRWAPVERNCTVETHVELQEQAAKRSTVELR